MTTHLVTKKPIHETEDQVCKLLGYKKSIHETDSYKNKIAGHSCFFLRGLKRAFDKSSRQRVNAVNCEKKSLNSDRGEKVGDSRNETGQPLSTKLT